MYISSRSYCLLLLWFGFIALCAQLTPYFANDYRYMLIEGTHDFVGSFSDILVSQYRHYFEWGGRSPAHIWAQFLLYIGKPHSAVIQAVSYCLLILFIYYNAYGVRPTLRLRWRPIFVISVLLFLQLRAYGEVVFNIVSSANFLYTTIVVLMFILPYRIAIDHKIKLNSFVLYPLVIILGFFAGWSVENTAAAVALMVFIYLIVAWYRGYFHYWQLAGFLAFLCGFAFLVCAPGNYARYLDLIQNHGFAYSTHLVSSLQIAFESLAVSVLLIVIFFYLLYRIQRHYLQTMLPATWRSALFYLGAAFCSFAVMIFAPNFPARACAPSTIFFIIAIMAMSELVVVRYQKVVSDITAKSLFALSSLLIAAICINMIWGLIVLDNERKSRDIYIQEQISAGMQEIVVKPLSVHNYKYLFVPDVHENPFYWTNQIEANFYNVRSIRRICSYPTKTLPNDVYWFQVFDAKQCQKGADR